LPKVTLEHETMNRPQWSSAVPHSERCAVRIQWAYLDHWLLKVGHWQERLVIAKIARGTSMQCLGKCSVL